MDASAPNIWQNEAMTQHNVSEEAQLHISEQPADANQATGETTHSQEHDALRDIADVQAVEVIVTAAVHMMSAAAVKCGLADTPDAEELTDLDEARKLINALAALVVTSAPDIGNQHARSLRDGLRSLQLAFREASPFPDAIGEGPGEKFTGPVS